MVLPTLGLCVERSTVMPLPFPQSETRKCEDEREFFREYRPSIPALWDCTIKPKEINNLEENRKGFLNNPFNDTERVEKNEKRNK